MYLWYWKLFWTGFPINRNHHWNYQQASESWFPGLLHLNQNERTDFYVPLLKTALHRVIPNLAETSIGATLPLAEEINRVSLYGEFWLTSNFVVYNHMFMFLPNLSFSSYFQFPHLSLAREINRFLWCGECTTAVNADNIKQIPVNFFPCRWCVSAVPLKFSSDFFYSFLKKAV